MKKISLPIFCLFLAALPAVAQSGDASPSGPADPHAMGRFLDGLMANYYDDQVQAALGSFTYEYTDLPTPFTRWLQDELVQGAAGTKRLRLFNRGAAQTMDPAFKKMYADFFDTNTVGALLAGRYFGQGDQVLVKFQLTDLRTGNLIGAGEYRFNRAALPEAITVSPDEKAVRTAQSLVKIAMDDSGGTRSAAGDTLRLALSTSRGTGAGYRDGEALKVLVSVDRDAYVKLYHVDVNGSVKLIWPNRFGGGQALIRAGKGVVIPGPGDPFSFLLGAPYGTEFIKAVASTRPFADREADFEDLGNDSRAIVSRGLTVANTTTGTGSEQRAEALVSYVIMEK